MPVHKGMQFCMQSNLAASVHQHPTQSWKGS